MSKYSIEELNKALKVITSSIDNCTNMQPKYAPGTSQYTLLKNRIRALEIAKGLIASEESAQNYTRIELQEALAPIESIINKCNKAIIKFKEGTSHYTRFKNLIDAMNIARTYIIEAIAMLI